MANRKPTLNPDKYVAVYLSLDDAKEGVDIGKITVQGFDQGDFKGMEELDSRNWEDGQIINVPCYLRVFKRKEDTKAAPRRSFAPVEGPEAAETQPL